MEVMVSGTYMFSKDTPWLEVASQRKESRHRCTACSCRYRVQRRRRYWMLDTEFLLVRTGPPVAVVCVPLDKRDLLDTQGSRSRLEDRVRLGPATADPAF